MKRRHRINHSRVNPQGAFTLIEILLALTLTSLVLTVAGQMAVSSLQSRSAARKTFEQIRRHAFVFDGIADDLNGLLAVASDSASAVSVYGAPRQVLQLHVLAAIYDDGGALHLARRPATVRYRLLRRADPSGEFDLIREAIDRTGHDARRVRETVGSGLDRFDVDVWHEGEWRKRFPPAAEVAQDAAALRITCRWLGDHQSVTRTFALRQRAGK